MELRIRIALSITVVWIVIVVAVTLWRRNIVGLALLAALPALLFPFRKRA